MSFRVHFDYFLKLRYLGYQLLQCEIQHGCTRFIALYNVADDNKMICLILRLRK